MSAVLRCPPLAALSDDQREEFKPRWQRRTETKQLDTAPFFVCIRRSIESAPAYGPREARRLVPFVFIVPPTPLTSASIRL